MHCCIAVTHVQSGGEVMCIAVTHVQNSGVVMCVAVLLLRMCKVVEWSCAR